MYTVLGIYDLCCLVMLNTMFKAVLGRFRGCMTLQTLHLVAPNLLLFQAYLHVFVISSFGAAVFFM